MTIDLNGTQPLLPLDNVDGQITPPGRLVPFPDRTEGHAIDPALINGAPVFGLIGTGREVQITLIEAIAAKANSLGSYQIGKDGTFEQIDIEIADTSSAPLGTTASLGPVDPGHGYGFFLLEDGFGRNPELAGADPGPFKLIDPSTGQPGGIFSKGPLQLAIEQPDGSYHLLHGNVYHAASYHPHDGNPLNADGAVHAVSGAVTSGLLGIAFEDLDRSQGSDDDFNDVGFVVNKFPLYNPFHPDIGLQVFSYDGETFTDLTADIGRGFGENLNRYAWDSAYFHDDLFISTWNLQINYLSAFDFLLNVFADIDVPGEFGPIIASEGGQIWRYSDSWQQVAGADITDALDEGDTGIRSMVSNEDYIFAGTASGSFLGLPTGTGNPIKLLKSSDGDTWDLVPGGPSDDPGNTSIRALNIDDVPGKLIVGTEKENDSQVWSYDLMSDTWTLITSLPVDAIGWFESFPGAPDTLFIGTWDNTGFGIYALNTTDYSVSDVTPTQYHFEGETLTPADFPNGIPNPFDNPWLMEFASFEGTEGSHLYAGTGELGGNATMIRSATPLDPLSWELITPDGFGSDANYFWTFEVMGNTLATGTFAGLGNVAQLHVTENGSDWQQIPLENVVAPFTYGLRTSLSDDGQSIFGTASSFPLPDFSSTPYTDFAAELSDLLAGLDGVDLDSLLPGNAQAFGDGLQGLDLSPDLMAAVQQAMTVLPDFLNDLAQPDNGIV